MLVAVNVKRYEVRLKECAHRSLKSSMNRYLHTPRDRKGKEDVRGYRVRNHTEVNLGIVIDGHVDLLLRLGGAPVVRWGMVAWDDLHRLFDQLVSLIFKALLVTVFTRVYTATKVVILRGRRRRSKSRQFGIYWHGGRSYCSPIAIGWDHIIDPQLLTDLFDTQMQSISIQLLAGHIAQHSGG